MLLHTHKMPGWDILFSLVCFPVSTSGLGTGLFFTPEAHTKSTDQSQTREKGAGDGWQGKWCLSSPKGNYLCAQNVTGWSTDWNNRPEHWELFHVEETGLLQQALRSRVEFLQYMEPLEPLVPGPWPRARCSQCESFHQLKHTWGGIWGTETLDLVHRKIIRKILLAEVVTILHVCGFVWPDIWLEERIRTTHIPP